MDTWMENETIQQYWGMKLLENENYWRMKQYRRIKLLENETRLEKIVCFKSIKYYYYYNKIVCFKSIKYYYYYNNKKKR